MNKINGKIIGNPTVTPMPVPNYNQNDPKKADYIKNRPCKVALREGDINETFSITPNGNPLNDGYIYHSEGKFLGLVAGNIYKVRLKVTLRDDVIYNKEYDIKATSSLGYAQIVIHPDDIEIDQLMIDDNVVYGIENAILDRLPIPSWEMMADVEFDKVEITVTGKGKPPIVTQLPEYFIPDTIARVEAVNKAIQESIGSAEARQIPCITGEGAPTTSTEGAVGCFYMDTTNGKVYKCTNIASGVFTWDLIEGEKGEAGITPHIGANGNWYIGDTDTGIKAEALAEGVPVVQDMGDSESAVMSQKAVTDSLDEVAVKKTSINKFNGEKVEGTINASGIGIISGFYRTSPIYLTEGSYLYNPTKGLGVNAKCVAKMSGNDEYKSSIIATEIDTNRFIFKVEISEKGYYSFNVGSGTYFESFMVVSGESAEDFPSEYIAYSAMLEENIDFNQKMLDQIKKPVRLENAQINNSLLCDNMFIQIERPNYFKRDDGSNCYMKITGVASSGGYSIAIPVLELEEYTFYTLTGSDISAYVLKDKDGNVVAYHPKGETWGTTHDYDIIVTIPKEANGGTLYINSTDGKIFLRKKFAYLDNNVALMSGFTPNVLYGKQIVFDGDSICHGTSANDNKNGYAGRIGKRNYMDWYNVAKSGATIKCGLTLSDGSNRHWISSNIDSIYSKYPNLDYLILEGGTNDADLLRADANGLGEISAASCMYNDFDNTADFTQALEYLFSKAIALYPTKKIGFIIAHKMQTVPSNYRTHHRRVYFDRCKEVCEKYGIPCLDLWYGCHLNPTIDYATHESAYYMYTDGQHLSSVGYDYISDIIESWIKTL